MDEPTREERLFLEECLSFIKVLESRAKMLLAAADDLARRRRMQDAVDARKKRPS